MKFASIFALLMAVAPAAFGFDHSHAIWTEVLSAHVSEKGKSTVFDYAALKKDSKQLDAYLTSLTAVEKEQYETFSEEQKLAFLINAYNAFTVRLIARHYPLKSIKDIGSLFSSPWKMKFFELLEQEMHLDDIEHGIIRKKFKEPRIHFALNTASMGCPSLLDEAFVASKLRIQLEAAAQAFLTDETRNRYDVKQNQFYLSKIFEWYGRDFGGAAGVKSFVGPRMTADPKVLKKMKTAKIKYLDYDWRLNDGKKLRSPSKKKSAPTVAKPNATIPSN